MSRKMSRKWSRSFCNSDFRSVSGCLLVGSDFSRSNDRSSLEQPPAAPSSAKRVSWPTNAMRIISLGSSHSCRAWEFPCADRSTDRRRSAERSELRIAVPNCSFSSISLVSNCFAFAFDDATICWKLLCCCAVYANNRLNPVA